jgi:flagellar hook-associated protein 3 FlgL
MTFVTRVSTADFYRQSIDSIQRQQAQALNTQNQLSSGKKLQSAADDPTGTAHGLSLDEALTANGRYTTNTSLANERLGLEENTLTAVNNTLNSVRDRILQANGGTLGDADRRSIAIDLRQSLAQLLSYSNTPDAQGRYIFAGSNDSAPPFSLTSGGTSYSGDDVAGQVQIGANRFVQTGDNGADVFLRIKSGNGSFSVAAGAANSGNATITSAKLATPSAYDGGAYTVTFNGGNYSVTDSASNVVASGAYTAGQSIQFRGVDLAVEGTPANGDTLSVNPSQQQDLFKTIQTLANLLETPTDNSPAAKAKVQTGLLEGLSSLQVAQDHVVDVRAMLGARLQASDVAASQLSEQAVQIQSTLSDIRDVDYAHAAGQLSQQLTGLQAAQQSFAKIQGLSLFNYLR